MDEERMRFAIPTNKCDCYESMTINIGMAHNRPTCLQCDSLSMYFCRRNNEFYCTNCVVDHPDNTKEVDG